MAALKFPGGAFLFLVAGFLFPAWSQAVFSTSLIDEQEVELPFDVRRNRPPALFVTVNRLQRHSEEFCQFFLSFPKFFPG